MLDNVIRWSLQNRLITLFGAAAVLVGGIYSALTIPIDVFPDLTAPTVTVLTEAHGMAAEEVELLVTFPIETAVNGAAGVRRVRSSSAQGISIVWVEFDWGEDIYRARQIVGEKLQLVAAQLPGSTSPPVLAPITSIMGEILLVGLTSDSLPPMEVRTVADWVGRPSLLVIIGDALIRGITVQGVRKSTLYLESILTRGQEMSLFLIFTLCAMGRSGARAPAMARASFRSAPAEK